MAPLRWDAERGSKVMALLVPFMLILVLAM